MRANTQVSTQMDAHGKSCKARGNAWGMARVACTKRTAALTPPAALDQRLRHSACYRIAATELMLQLLLLPLLAYLSAGAAAWR
jgi:hypothetical protein